VAIASPSSGTEGPDTPKLACYWLPHPEGYRKAIRKIARGKFGIDRDADQHPGYPGIGVEERGSVVIAENLIDGAFGSPPSASSSARAEAAALGIGWETASSCWSTATTP
jgi:hypothetical protein